MGRKCMKASKLNPLCRRVGRQKIDDFPYISKDTCFVCDGNVYGKGVPLLMRCTPYSNTQLPAKIGQLMGDGFMVIVAVSDVLCKRCSSLINQLDKLECDALKLKSSLMEFLNIKYHLTEGVNADIAVLDDNLSNSHSNLEIFLSEPVKFTPNLRIISNDTVQDLDIKYDATVSHSVKIENCKVEESGNSSDLSDSLSVSDQGRDSICGSVHSTLTVFVENDNEQVALNKSNICKDDVENSLTSRPAYECHSCSFKTPSLDSLITHFKLHSKRDFYKCVKCFQKFENQCDLDNHMERIHGDSISIISQNFDTLQNLYSSKLSIFECSVCKFHHHSKKIVDIHMKKHIKAEKFTCRICLKVFKHRVTLNKHLSSHCSFKCNLCSTSFQNKVSLTNHIKSHGDNVINEKLPVINDINLLIVNSEVNVLAKSAMECDGSIKGTDFNVNSFCKSGTNQIPECEQDEDLLDRIHSKDQKQMSVSLGIFSDKVNEECNFTREINESMSQENDSAVPTQHNILMSSCLLNTCAVNEQEEKHAIDKRSANISDVETTSHIEKINLESSSCGILKNISNRNRSFVQAENFEIIGYEGGSEASCKGEININREESKIAKNSEGTFSVDSVLENENILKKVYVCSVCGLKTSSESHIKRHFKCHVAVEKKTYKCHICERVLTTHSNLKRHVSLHETCESGVVECNMCNEILTDRLHLKHHMEVKHPESYQCSFCDCQFENKKACRDHEVMHPALQCDVCQKMFLTNGRLKSHKAFMHGETKPPVSRTKIFKCQICLKILTTYHNLKRHLLNHEKSSGSVNCIICNEVLTDKLHLRQHVEEKHPESHQCSFCHKVFNSRKICKAHETTHSERFVYKCQFCEKLFLTEARLKRHQDVMHRDPQCRVCGKEITNRLKLIEHERRHERHKTMFPCDQCPKIFRTPSGLKYHSSVHTGKYAVYCEICGKGLHSEVVLEEHKATHTKEVRYTCEKCGRTFSSNSTYRMHRLWHDNPLPYKCDICDRKFKHTSILAVHKRRAHTGERPYKCSHCNQTFSVSSTLNKHVILHTKEYPYRCEQCDKGFTTRTKAARHMAKVHNNFEMLNTKKKACEYKMVLHPSEVSNHARETNKEQCVGEYEGISGGKGNGEEMNDASFQVLQHVTEDPSQEAIFTLFQQDFAKF